MLMLVACCCGWGIIMFLLQKFYKDNVEFNSYIVAFIHALISCRCCEIVWYIEESTKLDQFGSDLTMPQYFVISLSAGYFLYDTIICFLIQEELVFIVHHVICFATLLTAILTLKCGPELIWALWSFEQSGPCLNLRFFIENSRHKSSGIAITNECLFCIVFLVFRYAVGGWALRTLLVSQNSLLIIKLLCSTFFLYNQIILYTMLKRIKRVLSSVYEKFYVKSKGE